MVFAEQLLGCIADDRFPPTAGALISEQIPTCAPESALVDAVRQMIATWVRIW